VVAAGLDERILSAPNKGYECALLEEKTRSRTTDAARGAGHQHSPADRFIHTQNLSHPRRRR
jgi:hypothetical protein